MTKREALNGKPYAGNPHVRFDEGEAASTATSRRGSLLYKELNTAGAKVVEKVGGIHTNDLFTLLDPLDRRTNWRDAYHHTSKVYKIEAKKVADAVLAANRER